MAFPVYSVAVLFSIPVPGDQRAGKKLPVVGVAAQYQVGAFFLRFRNSGGIMVQNKNRLSGAAPAHQFFQRDSSRVMRQSGSSDQVQCSGFYTAVVQVCGLGLLKEFRPGITAGGGEGGLPVIISGRGSDFYKNPRIPAGSCIRYSH